MKERKKSLHRSTGETEIDLTLDFNSRDIELGLRLPFFSHMLNAMAFHGGFSLSIGAQGDIDVDPHHLIEDIGLVMGSALYEIVEDTGPVNRFGHSVIVMDDALSEVTIDAANRPFMVFHADFPQQTIGAFDTALVAEFLTALSNSAKITLHGACRYGRNSHHMVEALFKALGKAIGQAYSPVEQLLSTKGVL
jgi:imidazoleglycerol-phosphate dehydratase